MPDDPAHIVDLLDDLLDFFGPGGEQWRRCAYEDEEGNRCLAGAVQLIGDSRNSRDSGMTDYLSAAIWPRRSREWCYDRVGFFNDHCKGFGRIRAVILKARKLAQADAAPPKRPACRSAASHCADTRRSGCTTALIRIEA